MKTKLKIEKPDEIECTLTITMSLKWWKELAYILRRSSSPHLTYPTSDLNEAIQDMVTRTMREVGWESEELQFFLCPKCSELSGQWTGDLMNGSKAYFCTSCNHKWEIPCQKSP